MKSETALGLRVLLTLLAIWAAMVVYTIWSWHHVAQTGEFYFVAAMGCPFCVVAMVGLAIASIYFPGKFADMPPARARKARFVFATVLILAFAAGVANFVHMEDTSNRWHPPEMQVQP